MTTGISSEVVVIERYWSLWGGGCHWSGIVFQLSCIGCDCYTTRSSVLIILVAASNITAHLRRYPNFYVF